MGGHEVRAPARVSVPRLTIAHGAKRVHRPPKQVGSEVQVWHDAHAGASASCYTVNGQHWVHLPGVASFRFGDVADEVMAIPHPPVRAKLIREVYSDWVLSVVLQALGVEVLHASAVLTRAGVIALCAASGTGKSTIAFGLSRCGYAVWADDAVAVEISGPQIRVVPLPFETRLRPASASYFSGEGGAMPARAVRQDLAQVSPELVPLAALCLLERAGHGQEGLNVERVDPSGAFPALLSHAYCFSLVDCGRKRRMVEQYVDLSTRVPVFRIRFPTGLETLPLTLDAIEQAVIGDG